MISYDIPDFDTLISQEETQFNTGELNANFNDLSMVPPLWNIFEDSQFTHKRQASLDYNINNYPLRTSIKLFRVENDSLKSKCSGIMIGKQHVLTATHCVAALNKDSLLYDSLVVCPAPDNGELNPNFNCSPVSKIYFFENWDLSITDLALLELSLPIGLQTGWVSIGFDSNDTSLLNGIFYKFSYPVKTLPEIDSNSYNGDTLYYGYGIADLATENNLGIANTNAIPGESGSSLVKIENNTRYTSYGVLTWSANMMHCRFTNWKFYTFKSIIENRSQLSLPRNFRDSSISLYPNPTNGLLNIYIPQMHSVCSVSLMDISGRKLIDRRNPDNTLQLDLTGFQNGTYVLIIDVGDKWIVEKVIKFN